MIFIIIVLTFIPLLYIFLQFKKERGDNQYYDFDDFSFDHIGLFIYSWFAIPIFIVALILAFICADNVIRGNLADQKIEMMQSQNIEIENKVEYIVDKYLEHENQTYKDLKPSDKIMIATTYPELSSNETVKDLIKLYNDNNNKIIDLKNQKIDNSVNKWWLYFGN